jgi:hypothetical protein
LPTEDELIRARWAKENCEAIAAALPGRTRFSVFKRARRLGLSKHRIWTKTDDAHLRDLWGDFGLKTVAKRLGRTPGSVYWRAAKIGLARGVPDGMESIRDAAERTGYAPIQVHQIVAWATAAGVFRSTRGFEVIRRTMSLPSRGRSYHFHFVDPVDLDEAIDAWNATETRESAARRRGISAEALENALRSFGQDVPAKPGEKRHWRIRTEVIDAALAARARRETLKAAAKRLGMSRETLARRIRAAAVPGAVGRPWRMLPADVDAAVRECGQ